MKKIVGFWNPSVILTYLGLEISVFGMYLAAEAGDENAVLLPKKQVPEGMKTGDSVEVFIYRDSEDRLIATTAKPYITLGELAVLKVRETARIGALPPRAR